MTPAEATNRQIERYRWMTGESRLKIALDLHEFSCEVAREGIRSMYPNATPEFIEEKLHVRIRLGYGLASGEGSDHDGTRALDGLSETAQSDGN